MKRITISTICLTLLLLAAALFALSLRYRMPWEPLRIKDVSSTLIGSSELSLLQLAEYRVELLFPYDFIPGEEAPDWKRLRLLYDRNPDEFRRHSSPLFYSDGELPPAWRAAPLYLLSRDCGLDPARQEFLVFALRVKGGLPLDRESLDIRSPEGNEKRLTLLLPSPRITDIIIEDRLPGERGFPETGMSPDQWSLFIRRIRPRLGDIALEKGLLALARDTAEDLMRELFEGAGFEIEEIVFRD